MLLGFIACESQKQVSEIEEGFPTHIHNCDFSPLRLTSNDNINYNTIKIKMLPITFLLFNLYCIRYETSIRILQ